MDQKKKNQPQHPQAQPIAQLNPTDILHAAALTIEIEIGTDGCFIDHEGWNKLMGAVSYLREKAVGEYQSQLSGRETRDFVECAVRRCDCESSDCHPKADCQSQATVLTHWSRVCAACAAKLPAKYLAEFQNHQLVVPVYRVRNYDLEVVVLESSVAIDTLVEMPSEESPTRDDIARSLARGDTFKNNRYSYGTDLDATLATAIGPLASLAFALGDIFKHANAGTAQILKALDGQKRGRA